LFNIIHPLIHGRIEGAFIERILIQAKPLSEQKIMLERHEFTPSAA